MPMLKTQAAQPKQKSNRGRKRGSKVLRQMEAEFASAEAGGGVEQQEEKVVMVQREINNKIDLNNS